jgi:hypothetical protein
MHLLLFFLPAFISFGAPQSNFPIWPLMNCNETLNAGPDVTICHPGGDVQLNATFSGNVNNILEIEWTPVDGLSDPNILNPIASVTQTTTYTVTLKHFTGNNLFVNGDFESGNTGFTSDYNYSPNDLVPEGVYAITNNPSIQHPGFSPCGDHTSGSGNMMAVNGAGTPNQNVWCQTIPVIPNTIYVFSAWVTSLVGASPAILQFSANNVLLGAEFNAPNNTCEWQQFYNLWNSGAATSATFCIVNQNVATGGNDFAMDDIYLSEVCEYEDEVTITVLDEIVENQAYAVCTGESIIVGGQSFQNSGQFEVVLNSFQGCDSTIMVDIEVIDVEAYIDPPAAISCLFPEITLDGSLSTGSYGISTFFWSTSNGLILTNPMSPSVSVGKGGTYQLLVSTDANGVICYDSLTVIVPYDTISPDFTILKPDPLSCQDSILELQAILNNLPLGGSLDWITFDGFILSGHNTLNPTVKGTGTYTLIVTNPENGCTATRSVDVVSDTLKPVLALLATPDITCRDTQVILSAQVISPAGGWVLNWSTANGLILANGQSLQPIVGKAGSYLLTVTDTLSGCVSTIQALINDDLLSPVASLHAMDTLGCQQDSLTPYLLVLPDSIPLSYLWSSSDGMILSGNNAPDPVLGGIGNYQVIVENTANGCRDTALMVVIRNEILPVVDAGPDLIIDCLADSVQALSTGTDAGAEMAFSWSLNGMVFDTILQPWFLLPGTYILDVTNTQNRCQNSDTLLVTDIRAQPAILINPPDILTCSSPTTVLDAGNSDSGQHLFSWSGPTGGIASGGNALMPVVQLPGWYFLSIVDTSNHCTAFDSVFVSQDIAAPAILFAFPDSLDCNQPQITLGATANPVSNVSFLWSSFTGNIISGATTPSPLVNGGGYYALLLTNNVNGCVTTDSVFVFKDPNLPSVSIAMADTLTCNNTQLSLLATYQSPGSNLSFNWSTTNGTILSGGNTLTPVINQPGTYFITLTDNDTGCQTTDEITILQNITVPPGAIPTPALITCSQLTSALMLTVAGSPQIIWSTANGLIQGSTLGAAISVSAPGLYQAIWVIPENGCADSLTVQVLEDKQQPVAVAGPDQLLPCNPQELILNGGLSIGKGPLVFDWSTSGQILSGSQTAQPLIAATGQYVLEVTDSANGCSNTDTLLITQQLPQGIDLDLTPPGCRKAEGTLGVFGSSGGQPPYFFRIQGIDQDQPAGTSLLLAPGTWSITLFDALGCSFDTTIIMPDRQDLSLQAPNEVWVVYGDSGLIELQPNIPASAIDTVIWDPYLYLSPTADKLTWYTHATLAMQYKVKIKTADGCDASALIQVLIDNDPTIFVPNVFSPGNGDGVNDRFFPYSKPGSVLSIRSMNIYDRWGAQVFTMADFPADDEQFGWDGLHHGRLLNPAVFVWVIEAVLNTGEVVLLKGDVTLTN